MSPPRRHKLFFWILLAAYSTFFAEVFAGSDMFPFFHLPGLLFEVPLYGLHLLVLITLIYRHGRPRFAALVFAGAFVGLYEAYITKMVWQPTWDAFLVVADIAVVEVFVLLGWHTWLSFVTPPILGEGLLTASRDLLQGLPPRLRRFYGSRLGWLALAVFGALFQSINSPDPWHSLLSGVGNVGVLVALTLLWKRATRHRHYALADLLPGRRALWGMVLGLAVLYGLMTPAITPERIPPVWPGQVIVWGMYAIFAFLFVRALRQAARWRGASASPSFPSARALLGAGLVFAVLLPGGKILLGHAVAPILVAGWLAVALFETWAVLRAVREVRS